EDVERGKSWIEPRALLAVLEQIFGSEGRHRGMKFQAHLMGQPVCLKACTINDQLRIVGLVGCTNLHMLRTFLTERDLFVKYECGAVDLSLLGEGTCQYRGVNNRSRR